MRARHLVALAQSAEHRNVDPKVAGSSPAGHPNPLSGAGQRTAGPVLAGAAAFHAGESAILLLPGRQSHGDW